MQTQHIEDNICPVSVLLGSKEHYYTIYTIHLYLLNFKGRARTIFCKQKNNNHKIDKFRAFHFILEFTKSVKFLVSIVLPCMSDYRF